MAQPDFYQVLGVDYGASSEEVERSFRRKAAQLRPGTPEFDRLLDAYGTLKSPESRARYDKRPEIVEAARRSQRPSMFFWRKKRKPGPSVEKAPTFSQLLDFDWESLEEPVPDTPAQRKAFYDELLFKVAVAFVVLAAVAVIFWALKD